MVSFGIRFIQITTFAAALPALSTLALADAGHSHGAAIGEPAKASAATRTIQVKLGDHFYEPKTIKVKAGETVRFVLTNAGEHLHEFNVGPAAMDAEQHPEKMKTMETGR